MHKFFSNLRARIAAFVAAPVTPDPLGTMSPRELADLPPYNVRSEARCC